MKVVKAIGKNLLLAVQSMHTPPEKICHRDIWPKNILCSNDGVRLVLIDLGVSRELPKHNEEEGPDNMMLTETGNFSYRAPEVILGNQYK